jgi:hypothetical protein
MEDRNHSTSAPAEKLGPSPARTTARAADADERLGELGDHLRVERVAPVGPRQGDAEDVAVALAAEVLRHARSLE